MSLGSNSVLPFLHSVLLSSSVLFATPLFSQAPILCGTAEAMSALYLKDTSAKNENSRFERFTQTFVEHQFRRQAADCYVIPVVFHVYGTTHSGKTVNDAIINNALAGVNADFHGQNGDYNTVHSSFSAVKASMPDITFALAQFDPQGNPTSGIIYYPLNSGYGNSSGYDAQIAADAWDNYRYMNVYIQNDLYANNVYNNSGIAWYPNSGMSTNNTARVVYNGAYLGTNTNAEFASVLTHEFAHWLNLIHTFEGGCVGLNDNVSDTPPCDYGGASYGCHSSPTSTGPVSCGNLVNAENYMDYSGASGCYKMFTILQTARVYAALQHPARFPLWQPNNVIAAGLWSICSPASLSDNRYSNESFFLFPSPAYEQIRVTVNRLGEEQKYRILDVSGKHISSGLITDKETLLDVSELNEGIYFLEIKSGSGSVSVRKFIKTAR